MNDQIKYDLIWKIGNNHHFEMIILCEMFVQNTCNIIKTSMLQQITEYWYKTRAPYTLPKTDTFHLLNRCLLTVTPKKRLYNIINDFTSIKKSITLRKRRKINSYFVQWCNCKLFLIIITICFILFGILDALFVKMPNNRGKEFWTCIQFYRGWGSWILKFFIVSFHYRSKHCQYWPSGLYQTLKIFTDDMQK